jgi:hypothetical protein
LLTAGLILGVSCFAPAKIFAAHDFDFILIARPPVIIAVTPREYQYQIPHNSITQPTSSYATLPLRPADDYHAAAIVNW